MRPIPIDKSRIDVSRIFAAYVAFDGDAPQTAAACQVPIEVVEALAAQEQWASKLPEVAFAKGGAQAELNRAVNYVQAHRLRRLLDRVILELGRKTPAELIDMLTKTSSKGVEFTARPLADLAKAVETCHLMTMRALGDSGISQEDAKGAPVGLLVMKAMDAAEQLGVSSADVVRREFAGAPLPSASAEDE